MPFVRPTTVAVVVVPFAVSAVIPPGDEVTVYLVIAEPPLDADAVHDILAEAFAATPVTFVGGFAVVIGMTAFVAADATELPSEFVAIIVKV